MSKKKIIFLFLIFTCLLSKNFSYDKKRALLFYAFKKKVCFYNAKRKDLRILPVEITANSSINSLFYFKNKLYLATNDGVEIWDVSDFYHPFRISSFSEEYANDIKVINSFLFLATKKEGLKIYEIKDISFPKEIAKIATLGTPMNIFILKNYLYLADKEGGLRIIDIKDIYNPREVGYYKEVSPILDVYGEDNFVYLACGRKGLLILDTKLKSYPEEIIQYSSEGYTTTLFFSKPYLYLANNEGGLRIIDIKEPYSPKEIYYDDEYEVKDIFVNFPYAYVDTENGLKVIKIGEKRELLSFLTNLSYLFILLIVIFYLFYRFNKMIKELKEKRMIR